MIKRQFTRFAGRSDLLACRFDEFSQVITLERNIAAAVDVSAKKSLRTDRDLIWQTVVMGLLGVARLWVSGASCG